MGEFLKWCAAPFVGADAYEVGVALLVLLLLCVAFVRAEAALAFFDFLERGMK